MKSPEQFEVGEKVTYFPGWGEKEHGIVKSASSDGHVFVVYSCGGNWGQYQNYTGCRTSCDDLRKGWV